MCSIYIISQSRVFEILISLYCRSLAFCGPASCAVSHAEKYLQDEVIHCAPGIGSGPNKEVFYPNLTTPSVLGLVHHKNQIVSAFLMEAVVGEEGTSSLVLTV